MALAAQIGSRLTGGEIIELVSDLGGGKTAFVRGLAEGMGSKDHVSSPSFTLSNQYKAGELTLHHFDLYRLDGPDIIKQELAEILTDKQAVVAVEWASLVNDVLPSDRMTINITSSGEDSREIVIKYPERLRYLFPDPNNT